MSTTGVPSMASIGPMRTVEALSILCIEIEPRVGRAFGALPWRLGDCRQLGVKVA
jgi:hypothetical protein